MPESLSQLRQRLAAGPLVLDGATGTELERRGVKTELPLWSAAALLDAPEVVQAIHRAYVAAGADILVANTFRTGPRTLRAAHRFSDGPALNAVAVDLARRAAGRRDVLVAASVAPVEDCYFPSRVPPLDALREEHGLFMNWLARAAPDLVWIETMNTAREAQAAAEAAAACGLPFVVSFVTQESGALLSGESLEEAVAAVGPLGPLAIGLNCIPARALAGALRGLRRATAGPLVAYGHIGNPTPTPGWSFSHDADPAAYAESVRAWLGLGVAIVGGCCGTTPAHIRAVRGLVDRLRAAGDEAAPAV